MKYLSRKGEGFKKTSTTKGSLGFFPYQAATKQKNLNGFIACSEIEMTPRFPENVLAILAPQSFWKELDVKSINQELLTHGKRPLSGLYLTQPQEGHTNCGVCLIKDNKAVCGSINDYPSKAYKFRAVGWLDNDKIISMSDKPFTSSQILELY